jgi:hypothetical protein
MIHEFLKDHFVKTAQNYFCVELFLSRPESSRLGPLTRLAFMFMLESECPMHVERLARKMGVSEIYAQAALNELVSAFHVRRVTIGDQSSYKFISDGIDFEKQNTEEPGEQRGDYKTGFAVSDLL